MKKIIILFLGFLTFSFTNRENSINEDNFSYVVELYPSLAAKSEIKIIKSGKTGKITLTIRKNQLNYEKGYEAESKLSEADLKYFSDLLSGISLAKIESNEDRGMDGMTFQITFHQNGKSNNFRFWTPKKGTDHYKVADAIISLLERKLTTETDKMYFAEIKRFYKQK